ncbi:MAG: Gfo/Idh/MocA family protein, partial [Pyrinomonadaceae bacterium]
RKQGGASADKKRVRYAVVGLGHIAQVAVLPAFAHASGNSELTAFVSGDPTKLRKLGKQFGVGRLYSYEEYDECLKSGEVDAVYVALPNHLHREYTVRAAREGVHVLCEKPMAVTERECEQMIRACGENGVKLMIAYRLHFEESNPKAAEIVNSGKIGDPRIFSSDFTMQVVAGNIRLLDETGGGTLYDIGIYCVNAARYLFRDEPTEVFAAAASKGERRFDEVEEMVSVVMRFPEERLATFNCSFGAANVRAFRVIGTKGDLRADPAYEYAGELKHHLTVGERTRERTFPKRDQFAAELVYFSDCVLNDRKPEPSGEEGLIDVRIIRALYRSAKTGRGVKLGKLERKRRPTLKQEIKRPPVEKPELVNAESPAGEK